MNVSGEDSTKNMWEKLGNLLLEIWHYRLELMSTYECTMVDTKREPTLDVRCTNVEMVDTERDPTPDVRCTNVEQHTMDA